MSLAANSECKYHDQVLVLLIETQKYSYTIFIRIQRFLKWVVDNLIIFTSCSNFDYITVQKQPNVISDLNANNQKIFSNHMIVEPTIIDLDEEPVKQSPIQVFQTCYFGTFQLSLDSSNILKLQFQFKKDLVSSQLQNQELEVIEREEYQLTKPMELIIKEPELTSALKQSFGTLRQLATFIAKEISNPKAIQVDRQKLTLINGDKPHAQLHFNNYKKIQKNQLIRQMQRLQDTFSMINQADMNFLDPQLLLAAGNTFTSQDLLNLYREPSNQNQNEEQSSGFSETDSNASSDSDNNQQANSKPVLNNNNQSKPINENTVAQIFGSQYNFPQNPNQNRTPAFKQNEIPIYERFRGLNVNVPRKEKIKIAEKMLRIGYIKQDIIRFFSGGADQMESEANRLPDYRNPQTARYKEIHMLVAKRQHQRHNQLLQKHGIPPIPELPEYMGEVVMHAKPQASIERRIKELLIGFIKQKRFKKLDQIQLEMKRNGVQATLPYLKKLVEELKQKSQERKESQRQQMQKQ